MSKKPTPKKRVAKKEPVSRSIYATRNQRIIEMHKRHWSQADIARSMGVSRQRIHKIIKDHLWTSLR